MSGNKYRGTEPALPRGQAMSAKHISSGKKVHKEKIKALKQLEKATKHQLKADIEHASEHDASRKQDHKELAQIQKSMRESIKASRGKYATTRRVGS